MGTGSSAVALTNQRDALNRADKRNRDIDKDLTEAKLQERRTIKLLLLGAAESGKSTFAKQMRIIHCNGFTEGERMSYKQLVYSNLLQSMLDVLNAMARLGIARGSTEREMDCRMVTFYAELTELGNLCMDKDIAAAVKRLYDDSGVRTCLARAREFQLIDSAEYYFSHVDRISAIDYVPSNQDILRTRQKTSGVLETNFEFNDYKYRLIDVGGQRSERRKWLHYFDNVTAVIFTAALSGYDQVLREDDVTNRMHESLKLFSSICNYKCFATTPFILFLNKMDIFKKKITHSPLSQCFPNYTGPSEFTPALLYIRKMFETVNNSPKEIYTHVTVATDTNNIHFVFDASMAVVLKKYLQEAGLF